ncbi:GTPase [Chloroflexota bacterium]
MPTNLPPGYHEVEKRYRAAGSMAEKIACLEELISTIPKHKGTDKLRADYRRRLSKMKSSAQAGKKTTKQESPYHIDREGAGQVVVIGPTNVGKSALLVALTNATPQVSAAPFTTWTPTPGMMFMENVQIQLIDTPPLNSDYIDPEMWNLIRRSDLILLMVDLQADPFQQLEDAIDLLEGRNIVARHRLERYTDPQRLTVKPLLVLVNKVDDELADEDFEVFCELLEEEWPLLSISSATGYNLEPMKRAVFEQLEVIRIYSQIPGREPDLESPFILGRGGTVDEFARQIHQDFYEKLKAARVWGSSAFDGQMVSRDHVLEDGDVVELRI